MWPFSTKKDIASSLVMQGFTDWHSHLLPGVDDGVQTMDETLAILDEYERMGVHTVWCTPHVMEDVPNAPADLRKRFDELQQAYKGGVRLRLAAENMLDNLFDQRLEQRDVLPIGTLGDHLLVETSYFTPPFDLYDKLERIRQAGYYPLLAHPERYIYMESADYDRLHGMGVKMQLNVYSLMGMYGDPAQDKARALLKKRYYNALGTDTHRLKQVRMAKKMKELTKQDIAAISQIRDNCSL